MCIHLWIMKLWQTPLDSGSIVGFPVIEDVNGKSPTHCFYTWALKLIEIGKSSKKNGNLHEYHESTRLPKHHVCLPLRLVLFGTAWHSVPSDPGNSTDRRTHSKRPWPWHRWVFSPRRVHLVMTHSSPWKITMLLIGKPSINGPSIPWLCES